MSKQSTTSVQVAVTGDGVQETWGVATPSLTVVNANAPGGAPQPVSLAIGNNSTAVPATAIGFIIQGAVGSTQNKVIKGVAGDTGFALHPTNPSGPFYFPTVGNGGTPLVVNLPTSVEVVMIGFV